ncbi:hypothetical protein Tco_1399094 [Tanacetum coccineum]
MLSLTERMELNLEARLMGETLVLNRLLDPFLEDHIELNDLNEPFELRRNQGDDLIPTIKEGEVIEEFRTRNDDLDIGIDDYPSNCDDDKKIHIGAVMNVPIFVGTFSVVTNFVVLEDMDAYHDEGMSDVIVGEPFLRMKGLLPFTMVSEKDMKNGISHAYQKLKGFYKIQKLKGFYKGVLNLGPDYIRDAKMEEWLTRRPH